jgi:tetratricopeptide (TPR) repeat protein
MTSKRPTQRSPIDTLILCLVVIQTLVTVNLASGEQTAARLQTAHPLIFSVPAAPRERAAGKVRVFDNALLDKLFATDRANTQHEEKNLGEAIADRSAERKTPPPVPASALLLPTDSFAAKITARTPSTLAAALRFAEQGRKELKLRQYHKAVNCLERAVSLGLRNYLPYIYYYLAQTHYHLANYQSVFSFLDVAESWLSDHSAWMTSIAALRQDNINAMGYAQAAGGSKLR